MNSFVFTGLVLQQKFQAFSLPHILFLIATISIIAVLVLYKEELKNTKAKLCLRYTIAALLFGSEVSKQMVDLINGGWTIKWSLPLHLCGVTSIVCIIMLVTKSPQGI